MKLITQEIEQSIPALYSTENVPTEEKVAAVKFFTPDAQWSWFAVEGEKQEDGDWLFFGYVVGHESEWGYFTLAQLLDVRGALGLPIERDLYFDGEIPI